jgi:hypothetical protein
MLKEIKKVKFNKNIIKTLSSTFTGNQEQLFVSSRYIDARTETMLKFLDLDGFDLLEDSSVYDHYEHLY